MAILFKFVNRFDLYNQAKVIIDNISQKTGVNEYNLYGYWGASGIGKTSLLDAIYLYLKSSGIKNYIRYDCKENSNDEVIIKFLNQESKEPGIAIIDHLEDLVYRKSEIFLEACNYFIKNSIPWRVIFCASKLPDYISQLLRLEQRLMIQLDSLVPGDTIEMINQIFPDLNQADKKFLIEYSVGYPQMISIFCSSLQKKKQDQKTTEITNKKTFLWRSLLELAKSLSPDLKSSEEIERYLNRLCYLCLLDGFMPDTGRLLLNFMSSIINSRNITFDRILDIQVFIQTCRNYSILYWNKNDYVFYEPVRNLLRKYMMDFEKDCYNVAYNWLTEQYTNKYNLSQGKDKGHYLLKLAFYKHQVSPFLKKDLLDFLSNEVVSLKSDNNFDAIEILNQETKSSEIGKLFKIESKFEIIK